MHANEMPWRAQRRSRSSAGLNRYPEPQPDALIEHLAKLYGAAPKNVIAGRGSDEGIDLLVRAFCRAGEDSVLICPPTFGMYKVSARIQGAGVIEVPLIKERGFELDVQARARRLARERQARVRLHAEQSDRQPASTAPPSKCVVRAARATSRWSVVDEAYIEFAGTARAWCSSSSAFPNLVILRTLSKAYALAGARCGALDRARRHRELARSRHHAVRVADAHHRCRAALHGRSTSSLNPSSASSRS